MRKSRMAMSPLTNILRRIHRAHRFSDQSGIPLDEVLDLQKEAQKKADAELEYQRERRRFLKTAGLTGLAMGMGLPTLVAAAQGGNGGNNGGDRGKVIVIGAGAGGLRTAHRLKQYGVSSTVYEANTRIGGRLFSTRGFFADDIVVERGGELISTEHSYVRNLVHQLNLELEDVGGGASGGGEEIFYLNNSLYTEAELAEDWRAIFPLFKDAESAAPWQPTYDNFNAEHQRLDWTPAPQWLDEAGVGSNSKLGQLLLADIVSEYGPSADVQQALNLIYLLAWNSINSPQPLAGTDERFHIVGGNDRLIHSMANELPVDSLRTSKVLTAIRGPAEGPYTCVFSDGTTDKCDHLVLAIPFTILRDVDIDPRIWNSFRPQKQMAIREMVLGDNGKLHLEFNSHVWKQERMINGHLVKGNGRSYSGPESYISMWQADVHNPSSRGVLCNYTGGYWGRNLTASTSFNIADKKDTKRLLGELEHVWPGLTETYTGKALVTKWVDNPWSKGAFSSPTLGHHTTWWGAQWERESNIHFAGEPCSYEYWGYINGAIESGENVAKAIAQN